MHWKQAIRNNLRTILFVYGAGLIMVLVGCLSVSEVIRDQVQARVNMALNNTEKTIESYLREPRVVFSSIYLTLQEMLDSNASQKAVYDYLANITDTMSTEKDGVLGFNGVYGYLRDEFIDSIHSNPGPDFIPQQRPWYQLALRTQGADYTAPYVDVKTHRSVISLTQQVYGKEGKYYGVIALDIDLAWLIEYAESLQLMKGGYGLIANQYFYIIAHPDENLKSLPLSDLNREYSGIVRSLRQNQPVVAQRIRDMDGSSVIVYFRKLYNDWYIGVVLPSRSYNAALYQTALSMVVIGVVLSSALAFLLVRLSAEKMRSEEENRSKSSFLAMMSHEIRTPLNAIIGLSEIQMQHQMDKQTRADFETIYNSGSNLLGIINDILDFSKIDAGVFTMTPDEYDVPSLLNDAIQLNIVRIGSRPIEFCLDLDPSLPSRFYGDELRVKQILSNLLSNAFKYTKEGKVVLRAGWEKTEDHASVTFSVQDTGIGIRDEDMQKLFTEFSRLDMWENRKLEGTGLGLAITKKQVEQMDGAISVHSEYGKGSMFSVSFRQGIRDDTPIGNEVVDALRRFQFGQERHTRNQNLNRVLMPEARVLVVDDLIINLDVAKRLLSLYAMEVDCVTSGREAVDRIAGDTYHYDAVFMDHMMPGMDGVEATRLIRELGTEYAKNLPIFALTANALAGNAEMFLSKGFNAFISKPIDVGQLDAVLKQWVEPRLPESGLVRPDPGEGSWEGEEEIAMACPPVMINGIDMSVVNRNYQNDMAMYRDVVASYVQHTPDLLNVLRGPAPERLGEYAISVHGLKGSSWSIGANELGGMAEALEHAAKSGDFARVATDNDALIQQAETLVSELQSFLRSFGGGADKEKPVCPEVDRQGVTDLLKACEEFDMAEMERILAVLESSSYESKDDSQLVTTLREKLDSLDYSDIQELLEKRLLLFEE